MCECCLRIAPRTAMIHGSHHPRTPPRHLQVGIGLDGDLQPLVFCRCQSLHCAWHELEGGLTFLSRNITQDNCHLSPCCASISSYGFLFGSFAGFFPSLLAFRTDRFHRFQPAKVFGILLCKSLSSRSHSLSFSSSTLS